MNKVFLNWKRLLWVCIISLYLGLFFYNFYSPFHNWFISYIYTMFLVIWLGVEYYRQHLFFQTGFVPIELFSWPLRTLFALFFYSSFVIGVSTIVWWQNNQIGLYPFIHLIGLALLFYSIFMRWKIENKEMIEKKDISQFYLSVVLLISSIALGYGSKFSIAYVVVIGLPLVLLQKRFEHIQFKHFVKYAHDTGTPAPLKTKEYTRLWHQYFEKRIKKKKK